MDNNVDNNILKLVDHYALCVLLYISHNPKTKTQLVKELDIPQATIYKKIKLLLKFGIINEKRSKRKQDYEYNSDVQFLEVKNMGSEVILNFVPKNNSLPISKP